jgi:V8-like Glu-specific endopeptidase
MPCPDHLTAGFSGLPVILRRALCHIWIDYGVDAVGQKITRTGTGLLFRNNPQGAWVVTAAHMLYHHGYGRFARHLSLKFGRDRESFFCPIEMRGRHSQNIFVPDAFETANDPIADKDYGVIRVAGLPNDIPTIELQSMQDPEIRDYTLIGYPHEGNGRCNANFAAYNAVVAATDIAADNIGYANQTTYTGMSGGPLLAKVARDGRKIGSFGLHIRGEFDLNGQPHFERAIRFNANIFEQIRNWLP